MKKYISLLALLSAAVLPATAQIETLTTEQALKADTITGMRHYQNADNWFLTAHLGINAAIGENIRPNDLDKVWDMNMAVSAGRFISPTIGGRLMFGFGQMHGRANEESILAVPYIYGRDNGIYDFKTLYSYLDVLVNITNVFMGYKEARRFNFLGFVGLGGVRTFDFSRNVIGWKEAPEGAYVVDRTPRWNFALRAGLMGSYMVSDEWDVQLELGITAIDDGYNGNRYDDRYDGFLFAQVGFCYHLRDHYGDHRFKFTSISDADQIRQLNDEINMQRRRLFMLQNPQPVKSELLEMTVNFEIDRYHIFDNQAKNVQAVAEYLERHPEVNVIVCGYADVQTAYPAYNMKLSKRRATAVRNMLIRNYGVDPNRVRVDYRGDAIQPYAEKNEWNRVVVFVTEPRNKQAVNDSVQRSSSVERGTTIKETKRTQQTDRVLMKNPQNGATDAQQKRTDVQQKTTNTPQKTAGTQQQQPKTTTTGSGERETARSAAGHTSTKK